MEASELVIGKRYMYFEPLEEKYYNVILIGIDLPDEDGDIFTYYKADETNEYGAKELNEHEHPDYENYWLVLHISDPNLVDPDRVKFEEDIERNEYMGYYYNYCNS